MKFRLIALVIVTLSLKNLTFGTTISPYLNLFELSKAADLVVFAKADKNYTAQLNDCTRYLTQLSISTVLKGDQAKLGDKIDVMAFRYDPPGLKMAIAGDLHLEEGKSYLLFLSKKGDYWVPQVMVYYVFEEIVQNGKAYLHPIEAASKIEVVERPDGQVADPLCTYQKDLLFSHLAAIYRDECRWDLSKVIAKDFNFAAVKDRALPVGCIWFAFNFNARWQSSSSVSVRAEDDGDNTYGSSNSATYVNNARTAMNTQYTGLNFQNGGTVNYTSPCTGGSAFNNYTSSGQPANSVLVLFNDPCSEIGNLVGCAGTLAIGGFFINSGSHTWKSESWNNGQHGLVVVNNGVGACQTPANFTIMITHEMTHACGMDHLDSGTYPSQNMNPFCCNAINTKDKDCMNYVYTAALPVDQLSLRGAFQNGTAYLEWSTQLETKNKGFDVERSWDGENFEKVGFVKGFGNSQKPLFYEYSEPIGQQRFPTAYYRLKQIDTDGAYKYSEVVAIKVDLGNVFFTATPNPVNDVLTVQYAENIPNEAVIYVYDVAGKRVISQEVTSNFSNTLHLNLGRLPAAVYTVVLSTSSGSVLQSLRINKQ